MCHALQTQLRLFKFGKKALRQAGHARTRLWGRRRMWTGQSIFGRPAACRRAPAFARKPVMPVERLASRKIQSDLFVERRDRQRRNEPFPESQSAWAEARTEASQAMGAL